MSGKTDGAPTEGMSKEDGLFHIAFAWLAALATSVAAWFGLS